MVLIKNKNCSGIKKAFTLIELMVVMAVVVVLFGVGLGGMITSQRQLLFLNSYENVLQLVRDQRSLALAGKALPDYTDYDRDLLTGTADLVTPANYGISFDLAAKTVTTFADLHTGSDSSQVEGVYKPPATMAFYSYVPGNGSDIVMNQYKLDSRLSLISNLVPVSPVTHVDIFYSPIFGDVIINPPLVNLPAWDEDFLIFGVEDATQGRKKCSIIHPVSGVPEVATDDECKNP